MTGDFGTAAEATVNGDLDVSSVAAKELITGDGDELASDGNAEIATSGDTVGFYYQLTRLRDGKQVESNFGCGTPASSTAEQ